MCRKVSEFAFVSLLVEMSLLGYDVVCDLA